MLKTLVALALSTTPALSTPMVCSPMSNADILARMEKGAGETLRYVGVDVTNLPIELTVSDKGAWTLLVVTKYGVCFLAMGTNWQVVEPKPVGTEN